MGIDIYLRWDKQTTKEKDAQYTGFATDAGDIGYLREAYHGGPYATKVLFPETWESDDSKAIISSEILKQRLPEAIEAARARARLVYGMDDGDPSMVQSLKDFVALHEKLEAEGKEPYILNSY